MGTPLKNVQYIAINLSCLTKLKVRLFAIPCTYILDEGSGVYSQLSLIFLKLNQNQKDA